MSESRNWMSIADLMAALMIVFMLVALLFLYELEQEGNRYAEDLNKALHDELGGYLDRWQAEITDENIIRFNVPFLPGSDEIPLLFAQHLSEFFPRYIALLSQDRFKREIEEIRVEGHTSQDWGASTDPLEIYLRNIDLSQRRASEVLGYCFTLPHPDIKGNREWLQSHLRANGMAFAQPIMQESNPVVEDKNRSRRVEFKVATRMQWLR